MEQRKKATIDVPCPKTVAKYNQHMGGVDLCDMLLALCRIELGTHKWYIDLMYYLSGICIVNGWLLYRRHCEQKKRPKKNLLPLLQF